ncbi:MAG: hypothetical protein E7598_03220 [Ruminococcaceae bacterium]|nr:hypothetical protein [Oscillospiraceae bacterium]
MKKLLVLFLILCVTLSACRKNVVETTETSASETTVYETTVQITEATTAETLPVTVDKVTPPIGDNITVEYDILTLDDEETNLFIEAASKAELARHIPDISMVSENGGTAEYSAEMASVFGDEKIISAVFTGDYAVYYERSEESGEVFYTINIDPVSGKLVSSEDIISDFGKLKAAFDSGKFSPNGGELKDLSAYKIYPYVSFDAENVNIYIEESGTYTAYSIPKADAIDFINAKYITVED